MSQAHRSGRGADARHATVHPQGEAGLDEGEAEQRGAESGFEADGGGAVFAEESVVVVRCVVGSEEVDPVSDRDRYQDG